ncbi:chromosome segregation protein [Arcanobacterium wilhelmae]|uniref:Chromosome partition protein Smc n=1 Tax=Arcanobacterium wilhelmae TaxID=1803177 RepID=A0ABT9N9F6_9ACTO|nr:chromosome segregation protein SMC [Arcanobacterium wilhelmae]MDP9800339.1 chromosome segregation protein [Arcanobacterium wilhelmae]WFN89775.1 chromosome segregation protein SMC [Arcanobacterium wilhelmae]
MHLKTLTLKGFKSFATSTTMHFEPGINCVVGPNGSGKSNVVDALAWVMGEQGAKNLRGGNMADVIFAGTAKRPALGRAEVSLTIDNTDGALPIEYSEVTISRTLFRAGGSEYAINGTAARLLDIQELLSDTGMGREMHVIIGQGKLDQVLTATAEDRRGFIEEAAGVLKHRRRKEKALRKLESMAGNLTRVEDLAAELRRQLGPLARQAATARRAQTIQADVFDARARLLADDLAQSQARLEAQTLDEATMAKRSEEMREQVSHARDEVNRLQDAAEAASPQLAELTEQWQRLTSLQERFRSLTELAAERHRSLSSAMPTSNRGESPEHIRERAQVAREEEEGLAREAQEARDSLSSVIDTRENAERAERNAEGELAAANRALSDQRENAARMSGKIAAATSRLESLAEEKARVEAAVNDARERAEESAAQVSALEQDVVAHTDGDDTLSIAHEEATREVEEGKAALEAARAALSEAQAAAVEWRTKAETLALSLAPEDATAWAANAHGADLARDSIHVEAGWESATEAAFGGGAGGVSTADVDAALDLLRAAREAQAGHVEVLIGGHSGTLSDDAARAALAKAQLAPDEARLATDVVSGPFAQLLAGTVLAVDLATARALLAAGAPRVATMDGDVVDGGRAWGGEVAAAAVLARQAIYEDALAQAEKAAQAQTAAQAVVGEAHQKLSGLEEVSAQIATQLGARDSQLAALSAQLGVLRQTLAAANAEVERGKARLETIGADIEKRTAEKVELEQTAAAAAADPAALAAEVEKFQAARDSAHQATIAARSAETEARLHLRTREERLRAVAGKADALENTAKAAEARIAAEARAAQRRAEGARIAQRVAEDATSALTFTTQALAEVTAERDGAEAQRADVDVALSAARRHLDRLLGEQRELDDLAHRREVALAEMRMAHRQLEARAIEQVGVEAGALVAEYGPHLPIPTDDGEVPFVREAQERRLAKAERDLAKLGKINPLALEEHAALEERQRFLTDQLADLKKSRDDLLGIVRDIDARVEEVLTSACEDVAREFEGVFSRLFPGGEGHLVLTDPDSILTTGVEIEARPPGKRVKRLSLLSGGERSLTAVAFLVAIFKARPSPFYVMDEVEAALDDVNLSRLIEIFKELQDSSQLLVITHQKRTMEIADTIYGVAMAEDGVTSVISQRLKELAPE